MNILDLKEKGMLRGHVRIVLTRPDEAGKPRDTLWYEDPNVVVDLGRIKVARLMSGETTNVVDAMICGNGGASPPNNLSPTAPSRTDTALLGRITDADATKTPTIVRAANTVRYDATFNSDELDHVEYPQFGTLGLDAIFVSELGLITTTESDELFARVTFDPISFQNGSSTSITVQWQITVL